MKIRGKLLGLTIVILLLLTLTSAVTVFAFTGFGEEWSNPKDLFTETNTYVCTTYDEANDLIEYDLSSKRPNVQVMEHPQITVLTHGLYGDAGDWSNQCSAANSATFAYDEESLIIQLKNFIGDANIYWAKMSTKTDFDLINITNQTSGIYDDLIYTEEYITDVSKHIIIVFQATNPSFSNNYIYFQLNKILSKVIYDVTVLNEGVLPKINLIGHSRGGLTNLQYALDHPDLVDSLISIGTPYFGTTTGKLTSPIVGGDGIEDIVDAELFSNYSKRWNQNYELYDNINAVAIGGYSSIPFLMEAVWYDESGWIKDAAAAGIDAALAAIMSLKIASALNYPTETVINGLAVEALEAFLPSSDAVSLAEIILQEIDFDWRPPFLSWYNDICVNLDSQLALSNKNTYGGISYLGFNHKIRYFNNGDGTDFYKVSSKQVPIPHNLEARDSTIIKWVLDELDIGLGRPSGYSYSTNIDGTATINGFRGEFEPSIFPIPKTLDGKTVTEIAPYAFEGRFDELEVNSVVIPDSIKVIGEGAFADNKLLESVSITESSQLQEIRFSAFANCEKLNAFIIPQSVNYLGDVVFNGCNGITAFSVHSNNSNFISNNGVLYNKIDGSIGDELIAYPLGKEDVSFTVPTNVKEIMDYAFANNTYLTSVDLNNVTSLKNGAFLNCVNISSIIGSQIEYINQDALSGTAWLINNTSEYIALGKALYYYAGEEVNVNLTPYVSISQGAFIANENIDTVTFGNANVNIGSYAFYNCLNLDAAYLNNLNNLIFVGTGSFDNNAEGRVIYAPKVLLNDYLNNEPWQQYSDDITVHQTTANYEINGGTINGSSAYVDTIAYGGFLSMPMPERPHYIFDGWYNNNINGQGTGTRYVQGDIWGSMDENDNFYAKWIPINYTITLDANGGTPAISTKIYNVENSVLLPIPDRSGYTFEGWYKSLSYLPADYVGTSLPTGTNGDMTLYAKWSANNYTITYNLNAAGPGEVQTPFPVSTVVIYGQEYSLDVPSRIGHVFNGWKDSEGMFYCNGYGISTFNKWMFDQDITLIADWTRIEYYIKITDEGLVYWVTDEGNFDIYQSPIEYGTPLLSPQLLVEVFNQYKISIKEGYKFVYFKKSIDSTSPILSWADFETVLTEDGYIISIYTHYEKERFSIVYNGLEAQTGYNPFVAYYDEPINYMTAPSKIGHTFKYWVVANVEENNRYIGTYLAPGNIFNFARMPDLSIDIEQDTQVSIWLEAVYEANVYLITLNTQYGTLSYTSEEVVFGQRVSLPSLSTIGRIFNGWYTSSSGGTQIATPSGYMTNQWDYAGNRTLYGQWTTATYYLDYSSGYTHTNRTTFTVDDLPFNLSDASLDGYRFMGWYTSNNYTTRVYSITTIGTRTLYAKWSKIYTVNLYNEGKLHTTRTGIAGDTFVLPTLYKGGYKGTWGAGYAFGSTYTITNAGTLNAVWVEKSLDECYNAVTTYYEIYTFNQLNNIRHKYTSGYTGSGYENYNSGKYELMNSISLTGDWIPIPHNFRGIFDGNNNTIYYLKITAGSSGNYGFFELVYYGTVKNLKFYDADIYGGSANNTSNFLNVGVIAGANSHGNITNCYISNFACKVEIKSYKNTRVGGIVGLNTSLGRIDNCYNYAEIYGCGDLGGIAGANISNAVITTCENWGTINYYYDTINGTAGGITGRNTDSSNVISCTNYGMIRYASAKDDDNKNIAPCMGKIIGLNDSANNSNNICYGSTDYSNLVTNAGAFLGIGGKNQKRYCSTGAVGRSI